MSRPGTDEAVRDDAGETRVRRRRRRSGRSWGRRHHLGLVTTGIALVVLVAGVLFVTLTWDRGRASFTRQVAAAQSSDATVEPSITDTAPPTTTAASTAVSTPPDDSGPTTVRGTITAVGDNQWTVLGTSKLTYTVVVTPDTTLPKRKSFSSFKVGDAISAKGALNSGVLTAASIVPAKAS